MSEIELVQLPDQAPKAPLNSDQRVDPLFGASGDESWFPSPAHILRRAAILDIFTSFPAGRLVEMGCGAGRLIVDWNRLGHSGMAIEPDDAARHLAARCAAQFGTRFEVAPEAGDQVFDYLVSTEVLEHLDDPETVLRDWLRHLKPGGTALLTVPAFQRYWGASDEWAGHVRRFEPDDFRAILQAAGLSVEQMRLYGFPVGNWLRCLGNVASAVRIGRRAQVLDRREATFASGRDRGLEKAIAPVLRSLPMRAVLRSAIAVQRKFDRGHGLIVIARKLPSV